VFCEKLLGYFCDKDLRKFCWWFSRVGGSLDCPPQPVEGVLRMQKSGEVVELYGRFMGGSDQIRIISGHLGQFVQFMQTAQVRINTGYFASR
jgi:hypothetical protein